MSHSEWKLGRVLLGVLRQLEFPRECHVRNVRKPIEPMRCLPRSIRNTFLCAVVVLECLALTSCGTTCVAGIFPNGTGIVLVKNSTPPPACPFSTGMGMMNVAAGKSQICEICTASGRAQHIFVTLKSIQLHAVFPDSPNNPQWLELAPQLLREPRQIDLTARKPSCFSSKMNSGSSKGSFTSRSRVG